MPVYEYECDQGHTFEALVPAGARALTAICPECENFHGHLNLADRILSATPTTFKHADKTAFKGQRKT